MYAQFITLNHKWGILHPREHEWKTCGLHRRQIRIMAVFRTSSSFVTANMTNIMHKPFPSTFQKPHLLFGWVLNYKSLSLTKQNASCFHLKNLSCSCDENSLDFRFVFEGGGVKNCNYLFWSFFGISNEIWIEKCQPKKHLFQWKIVWMDILCQLARKIQMCYRKCIIPQMLKLEKWVFIILPFFFFFSLCCGIQSKYLNRMFLTSKYVTRMYNFSFLPGEVEMPSRGWIFLLKCFRKATTKLDIRKCIKRFGNAHTHNCYLFRRRFSGK